MRADTPNEEAVLRQRLMRARHDCDALAGIVRLLVARGDLAQAVQYLARLCDASPEVPSFRLDLARLQMQANAPREALRAAHRALHAGAEPFAAHCLIAEASEQCGLLSEAIDSTRTALLLRPGISALHNNLGLLLRQMGHFPAALAEFDSALQSEDAIAASHVSALNNRGNTLRMMGQFEDAIADYDRALSLAPSRWDSHYNRGLVLLQFNRPDAALEEFDAALALNPAHHASSAQKAEALISAGCFHAADDVLRVLLAQAPLHIPAWYLRATLARTPAAVTSILDTLERISREQKLSPTERSQLNFALAELRDRTGDPNGAFRACRAANRFARDLYTRAEREHVSRLANEILRVPAYRWATGESFEESTPTPVFIIGMPRSGTTLIEQILGLHPAISVAGEVDFFGPALHWLTNGRCNGNVVDALLELNDAERADLKARYLRRLDSLCDTRSDYVTDKTPLNFLYVGFLRQLFPTARFVHCRRDARDTCLSIYFQQFSNLPFTHDLQDIARTYEAYRAVTQHWQRIAGTAIHVVNYESLVEDPETAIRALLQFLALPWEVMCLAPHTSTRPVNTASRWQARQPIHRQATARWRRYAKHLGPLASLQDD